MSTFLEKSIGNKEQQEKKEEGGKEGKRRKGKVKGKGRKRRGRKGERKTREKGREKKKEEAKSYVFLQLGLFSVERKCSVLIAGTAMGNMYCQISFF